MKICVCRLLLILPLVAAFSIAQERASIASQQANVCFPGTCRFTGNQSAVNQLLVEVDSSASGSCFPHGTSRLQLLNLGPSTVFYSFYRKFFTVLGSEASPDPPVVASGLDAPITGSIGPHTLLKVGCLEDNNGLVDASFQQWFITYVICADFSSSGCATGTTTVHPPPASCVPRNPVIAACAATNIESRPYRVISEHFKVECVTHQGDTEITSLHCDYLCMDNQNDFQQSHCYGTPAPQLAFSFKNVNGCYEIRVNFLPGSFNLVIPDPQQDDNDGATKLLGLGDTQVPNCPFDETSRRGWSLEQVSPTSQVPGGIGQFRIINKASGKCIRVNPVGDPGNHNGHTGERIDAAKCAPTPQPVEIWALQ
jgi:hypothetical protein